MVLDAPGTPLRAAELPPPELGPGQLRLRVHACGVCRTDLHIRDGELSDVAPTILGLLGLPAGPRMTGRSLLARR